MKFSIITATYNSLSGLKGVVAQLQAQSGNFELEHVVVDGGSTDGTGDALRAWETGDGGQGTGDGSRGPGENSSESRVYAASTRVVHDPGCGERSSAEPMREGTGVFETRAVNRAEVKPSEGGTPNYTLRWVSEPDQGLYDALNKGLKMATGDVIGILHTDDVWEPGVIERVSEAFRREASLECGREERNERSCRFGDEEAELRGGGPEGVYGDLLYVDAADISKIKRVWKSGRYHPKKWYNGWMPPHPALFVTRELAERVGEYRLDLGSAADYEWMLRAGLVHQARFQHLPETLVRMRVGGQSNVSVQGRLKAHGADQKAWELNGLKPKPWTLKMKVIRKIPQWVAAKLR